MSNFKGVIDKCLQMSQIGVMGTMTISEAFELLGPYRGWIALGFAGVPLLTWSFGTLTRNSIAAARKYFFSVAVFTAVIPGVFSLLSALYLILFTHVNLFKEMDIVFGFLPIIIMVATLLIIRRFMSFDEVPGFDHLSSLIAITSAAFFLVFILDRIFIFIRVSLPWEIFALIFVVIFLVIKFSWKKIAQRRSDTKSLDKT